MSKCSCLLLGGSWGCVGAGAGPERPFLECAAAPGRVEPHDPQVFVVARRRPVVPDLDARDADVALDGDDRARHAERLVRTFALTLPERLELVHPLDGGLERAGGVRRVEREQRAERRGARRAPGGLVAVDPVGEGGSIHAREATLGAAHTSFADFCRQEVQKSGRRRGRRPGSGWLKRHSPRRRSVVSHPVRRDTGDAMSRDDVEVVRRFYVRYRGEYERYRSDPEGLLELFGPAVEWRPLTGALLEGVAYRGHEGMKRYFDDLAETWERSWVVADRYVDAGECVLVTGRIHGRGKASELEMEVPAAWVWRVRDGRVTFMHVYLEKSEALAAAGLIRL